MSIICVIGCAAYIHVPIDKRNKLDLKATKCIFFGYGTTRKGYCLYDQQTSSIIHSRDVVFNESARGHECDEGKHLTQVESVTNDESEEAQTEGIETEHHLPKPESENGELETPTDTPALRRSARETQRPDYYSAQIHTAAGKQKEPQTVEEALSCLEKEHCDAGNGVDLLQ